MKSEKLENSVPQEQGLNEEQKKLLDEQHKLAQEAQELFDRHDPNDYLKSLNQIISFDYPRRESLFWFDDRIRTRIFTLLDYDYYVQADKSQLEEWQREIKEKLLSKDRLPTKETIHIDNKAIECYGQILEIMEAKQFNLAEYDEADERKVDIIVFNFLKWRLDKLISEIEQFDLSESEKQIFRKEIELMENIDDKKFKNYPGAYLLMRFEHVIKPAAKSIVEKGHKLTGEFNLY